MDVRINNGIRLLLIMSFLPVIQLTGVGQIAEYNFNENVEDQVGGYHATIIGDPVFVDGEYISFTPGQCLSLPLEMSQAIDVSESWQIDVRFKVEGDWRSTEGEDAQVIVSNKIYDQRFGGFEITAREWGNQLQLITTFGDGIYYEAYGCPSCSSSPGLSEGKLDWVVHIDSGIWYDVKIKFLFAGTRPYIQYEVNGTVLISYFDDRVDAEGFRQTIDQQQVWVGADKDNRYATNNPQNPKMDLQIDYLSFHSPAVPGDTEAIGEILQILIDEMNRSTEDAETDDGLTDEQLDSLRTEFIANWDDYSYEPNKEVVWDYINTYAAHHEPIFDNWVGSESPENFPPMETIQFNMSQWIVDNQYEPETVKEMEGLVFEDHELFPGKVSDQAPRLPEASFLVNGDYNTDPGFRLNDQEQVIRPSGYYVPPGELVTITVPDEAIDQGLSLFVGAHNVSLQLTSSTFRRFPRIMTIYELNSKTITVANPFGGAVYIKIPDGTNLGPLEFYIEGAVKAPYYSRVEGFSRSLEEFKADLANQYVPFVDIESRNFMTTITHGLALGAVDIDSALNIWDRSLDAVNIALGRPVERFRSEYFLVDRQSHYKGTALPASYPMSAERLLRPYRAAIEMPLEVEFGREWYNTPNDDFHNTVMHELGHLHNMPTISHDLEANVHLLAAAAYNMAMGELIDSAMVYSMQQRLNLEESAMDWILEENFYLGNRMGYRIEEEEQSYDQQAYQARGHAKYIEIAKLFGWEALGSLFSPFYEYRREEDPTWDAYSLLDDQYIDTASHVMGHNMAPLFEFWGIIPSDELVERLSDMPTSDVIKDRLLYFRSIVPADNEAFQQWHSIMTSKLEAHHHERYDEWKTSYDEAHAQRIIDRIDEILNKYYDIEELDYNYNPVITGTSDALYIEQNGSLTLALDHFRVEDLDNGYPDDFTLSVAEGEDYSLSGNTITPATDFLGELKVSVTVNDGLEDSAPYEATITVVVENDRPVITGIAEGLIMSEDVSRTFELVDFEVADADHTYPDDFTLTLGDGDRYTRSGNTIIPESNFYGDITIPVTVHDGVQQSEVFMATVTVEAVNDLPVIIGAKQFLYTDEDEPIRLGYDKLSIEDVDNYEGYWDAEIFEGENYTVGENKWITPAQDFYGRLEVNIVALDDQKARSEPYVLLVEVYPVNDAPVIDGPTDLLHTLVNEPIELSVSDFIISDPDHTEHTLTIMEGSNYTLSGSTITPDTDFEGELMVPVKVNDGERDSEEYIATVIVYPPNDRPVITGSKALSTLEDTPLTLSLTDLVVEDSDNEFPGDFTLQVFEGDHYTLANEGSIIVPEPDFFGEIAVPVTVDDGILSSAQFLLTIEVTSVNDIPAIEGLNTTLSMVEDEQLTIELSDLNVSDIDNDYPADFTLSISAGNGFTVSGSTITPDADINGEISLSLTVNDGTDDSEAFETSITVTPVNDPPVITGLTSALTTDEDTPITLSFSSFEVEDPDHTYPDGFTLTLGAGDNYSLTGDNGLTVTPGANFFGELTIPVIVNDGQEDSEVFNATIEVIPVNDIPVIESLATTLSMVEDESLTIALSDLNVTDVDNEYPDDFTLNLLDGSNYTVSGNAITPAQDFDGEITLSLTVNDGTDDSELFETTVAVTAVNDQPIINGLAAVIRTPWDTPVTFSLADFGVEDPDNDFPEDFTLIVREGENYTVSGTTIMATEAYVGSLNVPIVVNDGALDSEPFIANVDVSPVLSLEDSWIRTRFTLYPNPSGEILNVVKHPDIVSYSLKLVNLNGKVLLTREGITQREVQLAMQNLDKGVYLLQVEATSGTGTFKVVKQ